MIEEHARVVRAEPGTAWVEVMRKSACGSCALAGGCGTAGIARYLRGRRGAVHLRVIDPVGVQAGDQVVIGMEEGALLRGLVQTYAVPLLAMLLGALGGKLLGAALGLSAPDAGTLAGGALGLAAGLANVRRFSRRIAADPAYQPIVLRRADAPTLPLVFHHGDGGRG